MKIKGNTVGTPIPRSNYNQTDPKKADYLVGRENIVGKDELASITDKILEEAKASGEFDGQPGADGKDGKDGADGTSVTITDITESNEDGGSNVVTFSDGNTLTVKNGSKGADGEGGGGGNSVYFSEEEPTDAKTGDFWYDESEGEGGGASVQADWNQNDSSAPDYVKGRTHYVIPEGTYHVEEQTVTIGDELYCELVGRGDLAEGCEYMVTLNGVTEILTAKYGDEWDCIYLGNPALVEDGEDDGFPFAIDAYPDDGGNIYLDVKEPGEYTIEICSVQDGYKKIDPRFLIDNSGGGGADLVIRAIMDGSNNVASGDIAFGSYDAVIEKLQTMQPPIVHVIMMKDEYHDDNDSHLYTANPMPDLSISWRSDGDAIEVYGNKAADLFYVYPDGSVEYNYIG